MTVDLKHLNVDELTESAGGDPWHLNRTVQSGSPGEITELATAFYNATACTRETSDEFRAAQQRFASAWDRQDGGGHPINDSEEVKRATESLRLNNEQLGRVSVDLQNIAASLAEAQQSADIAVSHLDAALKWIDDQIDHELAVAAAEGKKADISDLKQAAIDRVSEALGTVQGVRDNYSGQLDTSRLEMAAEGYAPEGLGGSADPEAGPMIEAAQADADQYGSGQRAIDQALVNTPGPWTADKQAAAARLRDHATINDPTASLEQVRYAGQRLDDFHTLTAPGPLPRDPVLGGDARSQARTRLDMQAQLEQGIFDSPSMAPDQATALINQSEAQARILVTARVQEELIRAGMSPEGAAAATSSMAQGIIPKEMWEAASAAGKPIAGGEHAFKHFANSLPVADSPTPGMPGFSPSDIDALKKIGGNLGIAGNLVDLGVGIHEWQSGMPAGQVLAKTGGSMGGAMGLGAFGAWLGAPAGPVGVFAGAFIFGTIGSLGGEELGQNIYKGLSGN